MDERPVGAEEVRRAVLASAARLFATQDPGSVSVRAIAADAGVNYGLVHRHIGSKNDLVAEAVRAHSDQFLPSPDAKDDVEVRLSEMIRHYLAEPVVARTLAWAALNQVDAEQVVGGLEDVHDLVDALAEAIGSRERAQSVYALLACATLGATIFGDLALVSAGVEPTDERRRDLAEVTVELLDAIVEGERTDTDPGDAD